MLNSSEFRLRTAPLSLLIVKTTTGDISVSAFRTRFAKAFVECLNKSSNPVTMYDDLLSLNIYEGLLEECKEHWSDLYKQEDKRSKERDDTKRFIQCATAVFGVAPMPKSIPVLHSILK